MHCPILDVRPARDFERQHLAHSVNIPLEELAARVHELPPRGASIIVADTNAARARQAEQFLAARGHLVQVRVLVDEPLSESGPSRARLWQPSAFLIEALGHIQQRDPRHRQPEALRCIDLACGTGRDAVYLATLGYLSFALDVLPDALQRADDLAARNGVSIHTILHDLERDPTLPAGAYELITVFHFLHRPLLPAIRQALRPGGFIVYETFHTRNLLTGLPPRSPQHLLQDGELPRAFDGFEILIAHDAIERDGRFFSQLLARRP
jgi:tellurite methyltransferase